MPSQKNKVLEFNQYMKGGGLPYMGGAPIESLILKIHGCANNPEKSSTMKMVSIFRVGIQGQQFGDLII